jgi:ubiquinone/menaquinone biosynthesis C-methylase UbiE
LVAALRPAHIQAHHEGEYVGQESFMSAREILALARAAGVDAGSRVLDLCCGSGGPALHLARQTGCRIVGVDRSSEAIHLARTSAEHQGLYRRASFIVAEALCPPIDAAFFDAVLLYETMLAFEDKRRLVRVVHKLLRPGGRFGLTFEEGRPLSSAERRRVPEEEEVWLTPESEFRVLLEAVGFRIRWVEDFTAAHAEVAGRLAAAFRRDYATVVAALGSQTSCELVMAHERWAEWLSARKVRKLAVVAQRPHKVPGGTLRAGRSEASEITGRLRACANREAAV